MNGSILIVEDNPLNLELARDVLEIHGFRVEAAGDADECLALLDRFRPDLILMDIQLPGMDGLQLTRFLRAEPTTQDLLIIAMTAHAMAEDAARVLEAGCDGYLTKPIETRTFASQLEAFIAAGRNQKIDHHNAVRDHQLLTACSPSMAEDIPGSIQ